MQKQRIQQPADTVNRTITRRRTLKWKRNAHAMPFDDTSNRCL